MNGEHCQHDWRIDPRTIAASYPAKERLVCPICGAAMTYAQPPRPRHGRPPMRRRYILEALDAEARALAAGARFAQRIVDLEDGRRRRAVASQHRGIPPRWYQLAVEARKERTS